MKTRSSKALGMAAAIAALSVSLPMAISAQAEPTTPTTTPEKPPAEPQGNCDPVRAEVTAAGTTLADLAKQPVGEVIAKIPSLSTFYSAISGGLNPEVNIVPVLENGPYVVFAPSNDAFAKLDPAQLESLKTDPAALTKLDYYHVFLGLLNPGDVAGQRPTQQGEELKVTGKDGDITVNDSSKVICGGISARDARIYIVDTVLDPAAPPAAVTPQTSFSNTGEAPKPRTSTSSTTPSPAPAG